MSARRWAYAALLVLGVALGGCGSERGGGDAGRAGATIVRGTIDKPVAFDPAAVYDLPSADVISHLYQTLLTFGPGAVEPEPEAAERCTFTTPRTFECRLRDGLVFSDGSPLTAEDVVFSYERTIGIADPRGASSLLANVRSVEAPDDRTVRFDLKRPDLTFHFTVASISFAIVPSDVFPRDDLQPDDEVVGSGRYTLTQYKPGRQTVLEANERYAGADPPRNARAIIRYFDSPATLKLAVERGEIDLAYRSLSPTQLDDARTSDGVEVLTGEGAEIRYLVFNQRLQAGDTAAQRLAVRRAAAQLIDRQAIAEQVYNGLVEPLYSMVPAGVPHAVRAFADRYGEGPDPAAAREALEAAGMDTPVGLELWWTPTHYGTASADEFAELRRQLQADGLFEVTLRSTEWSQYTEAAKETYPTFQYGWFPDYPGPDVFTTPFFASDSFLNTGYANARMDRLLATARLTEEEGRLGELYGEVQEIAAEDVVTIPLWQGKPVAIVRDGVEGVVRTLDPSAILRMWLISRDGG